MARRDVVLQMHTTLDGFADSKTGFVPITDRPYWKELDKAFASAGASKVDTLLLGKGTYQQFVGFWPKTSPSAMSRHTPSAAVRSPNFFVSPSA
jgi:hypothetical protein